MLEILIHSVLFIGVAFISKMLIGDEIAPYFNSKKLYFQDNDLRSKEEKNDPFFLITNLQDKK